MTERERGTDWAMGLRVGRRAGLAMGLRVCQRAERER